MRLTAYVAPVRSAIDSKRELADTCTPHVSGLAT